MSHQNGDGMGAWLEFRKGQKIAYTAKDWAELPDSAKAMVREHAPELIPVSARDEGRMSLREWEQLSDAERERLADLSPWGATDDIHPFGSWSM